MPGVSIATVTSNAIPKSGAMAYEDVAAPLKPTSSWEVATAKISILWFFTLRIASIRT